MSQGYRSWQYHRAHIYETSFPAENKTRYDQLKTIYIFTGLENEVKPLLCVNQGSNLNSSLHLQ